MIRSLLAAFGIYSSLLISVAGAQLEARAAEPGTFLDRSHSIFFPEHLRDSMGAYQAFGVFRWNFLILEPSSSGETGRQQANHACDSLKLLAPELVQRAECGQSVRDFKQIALDWAADLPLRESRPEDSRIREAMNASLAKAALPTGEPALMELFRADPMESWRSLLSHAQQRVRLNLARERGFFVDPPTGRVVIPLQLAFSPSDTRMTETFKERLDELCKESSCGKFSFFGPHFSTLANERQIITDTDRVSWAGTAVLVAFVLALLLLRRRRILHLALPVAGAIGAGTGATILSYGSIHGLTLSFGTGIIGLVMDYGLQAAFEARNPKVWQSNLYGLLTTVVGLLILMASSIPLLRQMMVFSATGLLVGFLLIRYLFQRFPTWFEEEPLPVSPRPGPIKGGIAIFLAIASLAGFAFLKPNLDMRQFDFQDESSRKMSEWFFKTSQIRAPLFRILSPSDALKTAHEEARWGETQGIALENLAFYLPDLDAQKANASSWSAAECSEFSSKISPNDSKFFDPFLRSALCSTKSPLTAESASSRSYLNHLSGNGQWLTLWLPSDDAQEKAVRDRYPDAISLKEAISSFPKTLERELMWMAPLSIVVAGLLLLFYYKRLKPMLLALFPFFSGAGLMTVATYAFGLSTSFISVIALVMVFGFSLDAGIFATDVTASGSSRSEDGTWTGIIFALVVTAAGFFPLLFCRHPVLAHLGQGLFFGSVGTYFGTVWGIPFLATYKRR